MKFRNLEPSEIEVRIGTCSEKGCSLLLYKNARCDMKILDETVGPYNWQRDHKELKGNMYAGIGIYDESKNQWIWKWDCGTESNAEAQKGEASDSFKRAGFNWGIGRELYTAPFIWFGAKQLKTHQQQKNGKWTCSDSFEVETIECEDGKISYLKVVNTKNNAIYTNGKRKGTQNQNEVENKADNSILQDKIKTLKELGATHKMNIEAWIAQCGRTWETITLEEVDKMLSAIKEKYGDG